MAEILCTLTEIATGLSLTLPITPESLPGHYAMTRRRFEPIQAPVVSAPKAADVPTFTITAWLPGGNDVGTVFANGASWRPPVDIEYQLRTWMWNAAVLQYIATGTSFNSTTCTIDSIDPVWGELDRMGYVLTLVEGGQLTVTEENVSMPDVGAPAPATTAAPTPSSPAATPVPKTYTTVENDTLSGLAKQFYGSGTQWPLLYDANKQSPSNPNGLTDPNVLPTGFTLNVPAGTAAKAA